MDFETSQRLTGFLKTSFHLSSLQQLVEQEYKGPSATEVKIHLCIYHANLMADDMNSGLSDCQIHQAQYITRRFRTVRSFFREMIVTEKVSLAWMAEYNNTTFSNWFGYAIVPVEPQISADAKFGQGILEYAQALPKFLFSKAAGALTSTFKLILNCLKDALHQCFGSWIPYLQQSFGWFANVFETLQGWAEAVHNKIGGILGGMEECLYIGMGLTASTCIVALLERFLVATGLLKKPLGAPMLFVTVAVGAICAFSGGAKMMEGVIIDLLMFVKISCSQLLSVLFSFSAEEAAEGQFSSTTVLENLAALVSNWSSTSIQDIGRGFAAITQIKTGILSMRDMIVFIFEKLSGAAHKLLGIESQVLADLSLLLGENVVDWLAECDAMVQYMLEFKSSARDIFDRLSQLIEKGRMMRTGIIKMNHRGSSQVLNLISKALEKLVELHSSMVISGANTARKAPFMVFLTGSSGCGKTSVAQRIGANWLQAEGLGTAELYSRNGLDPFWSGYKRQAVVMYDDFGAIPGTVSNEAEIIHVVSRNPYATIMPGLAEKGMYFDSRLLLATSNFLAANSESGVHDSHAYERRRHVVVRVVLKEGVPYNADFPTENQKYQILESVEPFRFVREFEDYEDLWSYIYDRYKTHDEQEASFLNSLPVPDADETEALEALVSLSAMLGSFAPKNVIKYATENLPGYHYLVQDGNVVYFWHQNGDIEIVPISKMHLGASEVSQLKQDSLNSALRYQNLAKNFPSLNPLAVLYASNIVTKKWIGQDLKATSDCKDEFMVSQINELPTWQRAYLYVLSKHLANAKAGGWFSNLLDETKKAMRQLYAKEYKSWPMALKLAVGSMLAVVVCGSVYAVLSMLWSMGTGAAFFSGAAAVFTAQTVEGQSDIPNKNESEYLFRNKRVRVRNWDAQAACYGDSAQWMMDTCMATLLVGDLETQVCLMPGRGFIGVNHFLRTLRAGIMVKLVGVSTSTWFSWNPAHLKTFEGNELALYTSDLLPKSVESLRDRIVFDAELLPEKFKAIMFSYKRDPLTGGMLPEIGSLVCEKKNRSFVVQFGEYSRKVPTHIEYKSPTVKGDCGSLILTEIKGKFCLAGIHVAGNSVSGSSCFIPSDDSFFVKEGQSDFSLAYTEWAQPKILGPGCKAIGILNKEHQVSTGGSTSFVEVPVEWHLDTPFSKLPSVLKRGDPRLAGTENANYDPFSVSMSKYAQEAGPFDNICLQKVAYDISEEWIDASAEFDFDEVSMDVALNGLENVEYFDSLVLSTSEGFPYRLDRKPGDKGKCRYVTGEPGNLRIEDERILKDIEWFEDVSAERVPDLYCIECVKDERLPIRKVLEKPKSRTFSVLPMSYNIVVRKKFLKFVKFIMDKRDIFPCQVGINPYSREWTRLATTLLEKGNSILCCDYSRFDGFLPKCVMEQIAEAINRLCGGSKRLQTQRKNLMLACCSRTALCEKLVYRVENGIPSGFPLTVIVNSILNEILIRSAYMECFKDNREIQMNFNTYVKMVTYGDDNLISVAASIKTKFCGEFLQRFMAARGITITDGVDKTSEFLNFRELTECDFLKRSFKENFDGTWRAPMDRTSLWPQLHFVKAKDIELVEAYISNLNNVLRELYLHSPEEAICLRRKALANLSWLKAKDLLTIGQIADFHMSQQNGEMNFIKASHAMENLDLIDPLIPGELPMKMREILPNIFVVAEHCIPGDLKDYFTVSLVTNRRFDNADEGVVIQYPMGFGRGGLPTQQFMRENIMRKGSHLNKLLKKQLDGGRKMLFVSQSSIVPAYVFCVLFLHSVKSIPLLSVNAALTCAISVCKRLNYLTRDFEDCFITSK
ncbi:205 kDa polyprotein [Cucurbit mild mosaic virus]|uniref:RNA1 polyprotein n=1 Tax=Cucurbit mild mosaic virus TaxID=1131416 RepID=G2XKC3_9SECO|nr:205 kDa polyprotein [Cucurbit mild mosaic virus]ACK76423.1 205 kDa polyprotein [Cucurbit mild mosaic virus]